MKQEHDAYCHPSPLTVRQKQRRLVDRRWVLEGLVDELRYADSFIRLYAGLLAAALVECEPALKRDYAHTLLSLGVDVGEINTPPPPWFSMLHCQCDSEPRDQSKASRKEVRMKTAYDLRSGTMRLAIELPHDQKNHDQKVHGASVRQTSRDTPEGLGVTPPAHPPLPK